MGRRYKKQASDTRKTPLHTPLFHFATFDELYDHLPWNTQLVGIELDERARSIADFVHPERAVYLLGSEDDGLTKAMLDQCHHIVQLPGPQSMNVACAGSITLYDRWAKGQKR